MSIKSYDIGAVLFFMEPTGQATVRGNDTDRIEFATWPTTEPTEAEIDTASVTYLAAKPDIDATNDIERDRVNRTNFELNWDQEQRMRILEGAPVITKSAYKTAVIDLYKSTA